MNNKKFNRFDRLTIDSMTEEINEVLKGYIIFNRLDSLNFVLNQFLDGLSIITNYEDYDDDDLDEYGYSDISETSHLQMLLKSDCSSGVVIMEYFNLDEFQIRDKDRIIRLMEDNFPEFTRKHVLLLTILIQEAWREIKIRAN